MKLQILQENFSKALGNASHFITTKAQLPVLGNILFKTNRSKLVISSTNLEISTSIAIGAKIEEEGEITVPGKIITEIVSNLPSETISLDASAEQLKISCGNFKSTIAGMNASDFPSVVQNISSKGLVLVEAEKLYEALGQVLFAASSDETRPILTGVLFVFGKSGKVTIVATDGFRLSQKKLVLDGGFEDIQKLILPKSVLNELQRLSSEEDNLGLNFKKSENQVVFEVGDTILSSRILEGEFPNFERIIPKNSTVTVSVDKEEMLRAVKLSSVFARESSNIVKIKISQGSLEFLAESQTLGKQNTKIDAKVEGEDLDIAFNYRFMDEFLRAIKGEDIKMEFSNSNAPGLFLDPSDNDFLHLIMPVKIQE